MYLCSLNIWLNNHIITILCYEKALFLIFQIAVFYIQNIVRNMYITYK